MKQKRQHGMPCYGEYLPGPGCDQCSARWQCLRSAVAIDRHAKGTNWGRRYKHHDPAYEAEEVA